MNFKVNLFFHLYETPFTPFGFPMLIVSRLSGGVGQGGVIMQKNKFALKCISGKIKCFKTIFFQWKIGSSKTNPASLMENSINYFLFETTPYSVQTPLPPLPQTKIWCKPLRWGGGYGIQTRLMQIYEHSITLQITIDYSATVQTVLRCSKGIRRMSPNKSADVSADPSADESAGTFPEMSVNIYFFDHLVTAQVNVIAPPPPPPIAPPPLRLGSTQG